jgi:DNA ligase (NAD+)
MTNLKNMMNSNNIIEAFKKQGISALKQLSEKELIHIIQLADEAYYSEDNGEPLMSDNEYDILICYTAERFPKSIAIKEGHTKIGGGNDKNKVTLPYQMWSMDKIKPDTDALGKWMMTYTCAEETGYVLSCKLDGISALYTTEGGEDASGAGSSGAGSSGAGSSGAGSSGAGSAKLYTRGNGVIGQDISHLIPFLRLPKTKNITIRGEIIISKELFATKYASIFANPRNFVAGVVNKKTEDKAKYKDLSFVAYEVIYPVMKPSEQLNFLLGSKKVEVVTHSMEKIITNDLLSSYLVKWRADCKYEIDGVICIHDKVYERKAGNPEHAFAFKMALSDQMAEAKVVDVIWTPSKDGYLKPRVQIEPVILCGVKIEYATGFNAKFIESNKIGVGAVIQLIRSGDVIPHIKQVIQPAAAALFPQVDYSWNETRVDIMLVDKTTDETVRIKNISGFFVGIGVDGLSSGNIKRIIDAGFDTIPKIINMKEADFLKVDGFKERLTEKIKTGIKTRLTETPLEEFMHSSNIFGRGFGTKKFKTILDAYPEVLVVGGGVKMPLDKLALTSIAGMAQKTSEQFIEKIPEFIQFMRDIGLENKLYSLAPKPVSPPEKKEHPLYGKKYVMSGFREKPLISALEHVGAEQGASVNKNTFVLLVKSLDDDATTATTKIIDAKKIGVPVMTVDAFKTKYNIYTKN